MNENSAAFGAVAGQNYGGANYIWNQFHGTYQINYCWKFYPITGKPYVQVQPLEYSSCPSV